MKGFVFASSSEENCTCFYDDNTSILLDAGVPFRNLNKGLIELNIKSIDAVFITHEHTDHVKAIKQIYKNYKPEVYINKKSLTRALKYKSYDISGIDYHIIDDDSEININHIVIKPVKVSHYSVNNYAYVIENNIDKTRILYATDLGTINDALIKTAKGCSSIFIESNYEESLLWASDRNKENKITIAGEEGHLSNEDCYNFLDQVIMPSTKQVVFLHISRDHNNFQLIKANIDKLTARYPHVKYYTSKRKFKA